MKQINVLHVIDHFGFGGAQRIVGELLNKWNNDDVKLFCYALRMSDHNFGYCDNRFFRSSNYKSKYNILSFLELKKFIEIEDIQIIHLHLVKSIVFGILLKVFFYKKIEIIVHEHGSIFEDKFWYNQFLNIFQTKIDLFIAVSEATKRKLIENARIKETKIKILYNFIDFDELNPKTFNKINRNVERKKIGLYDDDFVIGFVGRLDKQKGCDILIKSIPYINIQNYKIVIAGDGFERKNLEKLTRNINIDNKTIFLGYVKDIRKFYKAIDILVVPSRFESFGISAVEAQALKIPVIASNTDGLNEVVFDKKTGLFFEMENEKDLAEKIRLVYTDNKLKENLIKNGFICIKKYSIIDYLINLKDTYLNA